jgi:hypothetical protein
VIPGHLWQVKVLELKAFTAAPGLDLCEHKIGVHSSDVIEFELTVRGVPVSNAGAHLKQCEPGDPEVRNAQHPLGRAVAQLLPPQLLVAVSELDDLRAVLLVQGAKLRINDDGLGLSQPVGKNVHDCQRCQTFDGRVNFLQHRLSVVLQPLETFGHEAEEQLLLVVHVVVEGCQRKTGRCGEVTDAGGLEASGSEQLQRTGPDARIRRHVATLGQNAAVMGHGATNHGGQDRNSRDGVNIDLSRILGEDHEVGQVTARDHAQVLLETGGEG